MSKKDTKYSEVPVRKEIINAEVEEVIEEVKEKRTLERVVTTPPVKVKRSLIGRLVSGIVGPEGVSGIGEYVNEEIIKPAIKNIIVDAVTSGINMVMYGERGGRGGSTGGYRPTTNYQRATHQSSYQRTNYTSRYTQHNPEPAPVHREPVRSRHTIEEYIIPDRVSASEVLVVLTENADSYGSVSVADYYELIGVASTYTDNNYGWTVDTIHRATIIGVRGGFVIKFPPLEVI